MSPPPLALIRMISMTTFFLNLHRAPFAHAQARAPFFSTYLFPAFPPPTATSLLFSSLLFSSLLSLPPPPRPSTREQWPSLPPFPFVPAYLFPGRREREEKKKSKGANSHAHSLNPSLPLSSALNSQEPLLSRNIYHIQDARTKNTFAFLCAASFFEKNRRHAKEGPLPQKRTGKKKKRSGSSNITESKSTQHQAGVRKGCGVKREGEKNEYFETNEPSAPFSHTCSGGARAPAHPIFPAHVPYGCSAVVPLRPCFEFFVCRRGSRVVSSSPLLGGWALFVYFLGKKGSVALPLSLTHTVTHL